MANLEWNDDILDELEFPVRYWQYIEDLYGQFLEGEHIASKAYEDRNDYIGFTDDYDFCWGAVEEGVGIPEGEEFSPENGRLWGVYTKTEGEIYLLKANEDLTGWERHEQLVFVPSGSRRASIEFNHKGYYEIAVEFKPAGSEEYEIWLLSYPYSGGAIRQVAMGTNPQLFIDHLGRLFVFYGDNEELNIKYKYDGDNFNNEENLDFIFQPERKLYLRRIFKLVKSIGDGLDKVIEILFYKRDDDYRPYKYITAEYTKAKDKIFIEPTLENMSWEDMRVLLNLFTYDTNTTQGATAKLTFEENQDQQESIFYTDSQGTGTAKVLPYQTIYDVKVEHGEFELDIGLLITENENLEMDIDIPLYGEDSKLLENIDLNIEPELTFIEWITVVYKLYTTVYESSGNPASNVEVLFKEQEEQDDFTATTDINGECEIDVLPYSTPYDVELTHNTLGTQDLGVLVDGYDETYEMTINLFYIDDLVDRINSFELEPELTFIEWYDTTYTLNFKLVDMLGNNIENAEIKIYEQQDQEEKVLTTDTNGEVTTNVIPYSEPYDIQIEDNGYAESYIGLLIDGHEETKEMDINLQLFEGANSLEDNANSITNKLESILWVEV